MNLQNLIHELGKINGKDKNVYFAFGNDYMPFEFCSWRGSYDELALIYGGSSSMEGPVTVKEFFQDCKDADGNYFEGYKGGEYKCSDSDRIWVVDDYSSCGHCIISGIVETDYCVYINTKFEEY